MMESKESTVNQIVSQLKSEGFEVYTDHFYQFLPESIVDLPDAVAFRSGEKVLIQVEYAGKPSSRTEALKNFVDQRTEWKHRLYVLRPQRSSALEKSSKREIIDELFRARILLENGHVAPALLVAWACLESTVRYRFTHEFEKSQTPARIIDLLATKGEISPSAADKLRSLAKKRNSYIHGDFTSPHARKDDVLYLLRQISKFYPEIRNINELSPSAEYRRRTDGDMWSR